MILNGRDQQRSQPQQLQQDGQRADQLVYCPLKTSDDYRAVAMFEPEAAVDAHAVGSSRYVQDGVLVTRGSEVQPSMPLHKRLVRPFPRHPSVIGDECVPPKQRDERLLLRPVFLNAVEVGYA